MIVQRLLTVLIDKLMFVFFAQPNNKRGKEAYYPKQMAQYGHFPCVFGHFRLVIFDILLDLIVLTRLSLRLCVLVSLCHNSILDKVIFFLTGEFCFAIVAGRDSFEQALIYALTTVFWAQRNQGILAATLSSRRGCGGPRRNREPQ